MKKVHYGIDAPAVIRNLFIASAFGFLLPIFFPWVVIGRITIGTSGFVWMGFSCGATGVLMLLYSTWGKLRHRDRMLNMIDWRGDETVLDVGTGSGLLMIGAAKRLSTGRSVGIDIWKSEDLTSNDIERTQDNAIAEGVQDKIEIRNDDATKLSFEDESFDVVMSNQCLHNIYSIDGRAKACAEIARVLKRGGTALLSDFKHLDEYRSNFERLGLQTELSPKSYLTTFPPLRILTVRKLD